MSEQTKASPAEPLPGERLLALRAAVVRRERGGVGGETRMLADAARELLEEIDRLRSAQATDEQRIRAKVAAEIEQCGIEHRTDRNNPASSEEWACYTRAALVARGDAR